MARFTVHGVIPGQAGVPYVVVVDDATPRTGGRVRRTDPIDATRRGVVASSSPADIGALLDVHDGDHVAVTPTGPYLTFTFDDPKAVLAGLTAWTRVTRIDGTPPVLWEAPADEPEGIVY